MKQITILLFACIAITMNGQVATWPAIVGLEFSNGTLSPVQVVPSTGQLLSLTNQPTSQDHFLSGNSAIDVAGRRYFYVAGAGVNPELIIVDLTTGMVQQSFNLPRGGAINQPLSAMTYHPGLQMIYGVQQTNQGLFLVSVNPQNGAYQVISQQPVAANEFTGEAALDTANGMLYIISGYRGTTLSMVDIQSGQVTYVNLPTPGGTAGLVHRMVNIVYSHTDSVLYGLQFRTGSLTFCSMDPITGQFSFPAPGPTTADMFQAGNAVIDEAAGVYYYTRSPFGLTEMIAVDVYSGQVLSAKLVQPLLNHAQFVNPEFFPVQQPLARFVMTKDCSTQTVHFQNQSLGKQFVWSFGDGTTSTDISPVHTYNQPGFYQVQLIAHGDTLTHRTTHAMHMAAPPTPIILGASELPVGQRALLRVGQSADAYRWSTGKTTPAITIERGGEYSVSITVDGCTGADTIRVETLKPYDAPNRFNQIFTFADTFSGSIQIRNLTGEAIEFPYSVSRSVPFEWEAYLSATGDCSFVTRQLIYPFFQLPPFGEGELRVDWMAPSAGEGELILKLEHPFGGTLEEFTFRAIARKATGFDRPDMGTFSLSPLPVSAGGWVQASTPLPESGVIRDLTGRIINSIEAGTDRFPAPNVPGIYWLQLEDGSQVRFMVQ